MKNFFLIMLLIGVVFVSGCYNMYNDVWDDTNKPTSIHNLAALAGDTQVALTWTDPPENSFDHVAVSWSPADGNPVQPATIAKGIQAITITGLTNGTLYTFIVKTYDNKEDVVSSLTVTATPSSLPPFSILNLTALAGDAQVVLSWTDPTESRFDHVAVSWSPTDGNPVQPAAVTKGVQTITITGLTNGTLYTFMVKTYDNTGSVVYSLTITSTPSSVINSKDITAFSIKEPITNLMISGVITGTNITVSLPEGAVKSSLLATFTHTGAAVKIGSTVQVSGTTINDFTTDRTYSVYAQNGTKKDYIVTVRNKSITKKTNGLPGSSMSWSSITSSADGIKLAASTPDNGIYVSSDGGTSWTHRTSINAVCRSIASSSDGNYLSIAAGWGDMDPDDVFTSSDFGASWTRHSSVFGGANEWSSIASSSNGWYLVAAQGMNTDGDGRIYIGEFDGDTWSWTLSNAPNLNWTAVASSYSGMKLVAVANGGNIYTSTDAGVNWTARDSAREWVSVASSSDGSVLWATVNNGLIYKSTNSGLTWTAMGATQQWGSVSC
jgi:hypothetical protein